MINELRNDKIAAGCPFTDAEWRDLNARIIRAAFPNAGGP